MGLQSLSSGAKLDTRAPATEPEPRSAHIQTPRLREANLVLVTATVVGLALRFYQLARPGYLLGVPQYDDGVDFGSALRLLDGYMPYRDFAFVQPPGISLLLVPAALIAKATSSDSGFAVARVMTVCAGGAGVALGGLLVRHRGVLATTVACGLLAVFPDAVESSSTVFLEPWLVMFCLLGAVAIFEEDHFTPNRRRLLWGGVAFGVAGAVKVWAVFPAAVVVALLCIAKHWRRVTLYIGGVALGFAVPVIAFFAMAPRRFFDGVISAQLSRVDVVRPPVKSRLASLFGIANFAGSPVKIIAFAVAVMVLSLFCFTYASYRLRRRPPAIEWFALLSGALVLGSFLWAPDFYGHYAAFFAPFLALSIALPAARLVTSLSREGGGGFTSRRVGLAALAMAAIAFSVMAVDQLVHESGSVSTGEPVADRHLVPPGACVLADTASFTIAADRFASSSPGCSPLVDSVGTDYALSGGRNALSGAGRTPAVQSTWLAAFHHAQYVWLFCGPPRATICNQWTNRRIPWTAPILSYFLSHFRLVSGPALARAPGMLYARVR